MNPSSTYYPTKDIWLTKEPEAVGMDSNILKSALSMALEDITPDYPADVDINEYKALELQKFSKGYDDGKIIGPLKRKGSINGLVIRNGYIVAKFGDTSKPMKLPVHQKVLLQRLPDWQKKMD